MNSHDNASSQQRKWAPGATRAHPRLERGSNLGAAQSAPRGTMVPSRCSVVFPIVLALVMFALPNVTRAQAWSLLSIQPTTTAALYSSTDPQVLLPGFDPTIPIEALKPGHVGPVGSSMASCGTSSTGVCSEEPATLERAASLWCPQGSFPDLGKSSCWTCPAGYTRSAAPVDGARACQKSDASVKGGRMAAGFQGRLCPAGSFFDPIRGGECYSCPAGYKRSAAHIDASNACYVPAGETLSATTKHKKTPWPHECSAGTFHDAIGGGCYSCPSGYVRTAFAVWDSRACSKAVGEQHAQATLVKRAECGPGEFKDARIQGTQDVSAGGGCWTCPEATDRTIFAVDTHEACERAPGLAFARATNVKAMTCEPGEIFDPINSDHPQLKKAVDTHNALYPQQKITPVAAGGTCWSCPTGASRSVYPVYGGQACRTYGIKWQPAPYDQPGLFGLNKAESVALKLVQERSTIDLIIKGLQEGPERNLFSRDFASTVWKEIGEHPENSDVLKIAVFSRVIAAANDPTRATADEIALRDDVYKQIRAFRIYIAENALDAYEVWKDNEDFRKQHFMRSQLAAQHDLGDVPPDFEAITWETIVGSLTASGAASAAILLSATSKAFVAKLFPYGMRSFNVAAPRVGAAAARAGVKVTEQTVKIAGRLVTLGGRLATAVGPQIIISLAIELVAVAIEQEIDKANAEPKLKAGLATAQNTPIDFKRLMATQDGSLQAAGYWMQLMAGPAPLPNANRPALPPGNRAAFAAAANGAMAAN